MQSPFLALSPSSQRDRGAAFPRCLIPCNCELLPKNRAVLRFAPAVPQLSFPLAHLGMEWLWDGFVLLAARPTPTLPVRDCSTEAARRAGDQCQRRPEGQDPQPLEQDPSSRSRLQFQQLAWCETTSVNHLGKYVLV